MIVGVKLRDQVTKWEACKGHHWKRPNPNDLAHSECTRCGAPLAWQVAGCPSAETIERGILR